jgi:hypothetical protein
MYDWRHIKHHIKIKSENRNYSMIINPSVHSGLLFTTYGTVTPHS